MCAFGIIIGALGPIQLTRNIGTNVMQAIQSHMSFALSSHTCTEFPSSSYSSNDSSSSRYAPYASHIHYPSTATSTNCPARQALLS